MVLPAIVRPTMSNTPQQETEGSLNASILAWNSRKKYTDFCLKANSGEEFKCHKERLADSSSFFRAMLENEFLETKNSCMQVAEFKAETTLHFLEYVYKDPRDPAAKEFNPVKFTPDLLNMAHCYDLKDLQEDCIHYLEQNISKENVVGAWLASQRCGNSSLKESAMTYLMEAKIKEPDSEVHGFEDIENSHVLLKELMKFTFQDLHTKKYIYSERTVWQLILKKGEEEAEKGNSFPRLIEKLKNFSQTKENSTGEKIPTGLLIFLDTKEKAEFVSGVMKRNGWNVIGTIDEGWSQDQKTDVCKQFMEPMQSRPCLIAIKMSARIMENVRIQDIQDIRATIVLNYDFPENMEEYKLRLKLAEGCRLWSYFSASKDKKLAEGLIKVLLNTKQNVNKYLIQCWLDYKESPT